VKLAIPHAPRKVKWRQVPGAIRRLAVVAALGLLCAAVAGLGARAAAGKLSAERGFLARAEEVAGVVTVVKLPPGLDREGATATVDVLYHYADLQLSATGVQARAEDVEGLGKGAVISLLVDPKDPDHPREARYARARGRTLDLLPYGAVGGLLVGICLFGLELRRTVRADLEPLRAGALVWLTPDDELPRTRRETVFKASYFREDVKYPVKARARPGRAPVRNGEKVLAAVVPRKPSWVRVIDEDLARILGWMESP
jgi:hypothetical protein